MLFRAIKTSKAGIAAVIVAVALVGCEGESGNAGVPVNGDQQDHAGGEISQVGSATLTWIAPSYRVDGTTQLGDSDISGYIVSYGRSATELDQSADVGFCVSCQFEVGSLERGTWYFAVQTVDSNGLVSARSEVVSKPIES